MTRSRRVSGPADRILLRVPGSARRRACDDEIAALRFLLERVPPGRRQFFLGVVEILDTEGAVGVLDVCRVVCEALLPPRGATR